MSAPKPLEAPLQLRLGSNSVRELERRLAESTLERGRADIASSERLQVWRARLGVSRAALRAKDELTPDDELFARRGFHNLPVGDRTKVTQLIEDTLAAIKGVARLTPAKTPAARAMVEAHYQLRSYALGVAANGLLHKALKDMLYAEPPIAIDGVTGQSVAPHAAHPKARQNYRQALLGWEAANAHADRLLAAIATADRIHQSRLSSQPALGPAR